MNITIKDTGSAKNEAETIIACYNKIDSCVGTMRYLYKQLPNMWNGEQADIADILTKLNSSITYYETKIMPALEKLGSSILAYATATEVLANKGKNMSPSEYVLTNSLKANAAPEVATTNIQYDGDARTVELPKNVNSSTTTYMNWNQKWNQNSRQRQVYDKAFANNDVTLDEDGFYYINDGETDRYVVACTEKYGVSGDYIDVYQEDGNVLKCVIGDTKSYHDSNSGEYGHMYSGTINVLEYMTDWSGGHSNPGIVRSNLQQNVVKVVNTGKKYI